MADHYLDLETDVRREALEFAASESGRPAHLLEKDIWVVWLPQSDEEARTARSIALREPNALNLVNDN